MGNGAVKYSASTKAEDVAEAFKANIKGKYVVVTGGNSGIGLETVKQLALHGAHVVLCTRSIKNGEDAIAEFRSRNPAADITIMPLDLGSLDSVATFCLEYQGTKKPLHLLINNAGIMACPRALTENGIESQFGVNHVGHFLLTTQLLPLLIASGTKQSPSRVVNLSSFANIAFPPAHGISLDDVKGEKSYEKWGRYGESKLANVVFTKELNRRLTAAGHPVIAVSLHPGMILSTNLLKDSSIGNILNSLGSIGWKPRCWLNMFTERSKTIPEGASTTLVCALDPAVVPGAYYADCQLSPLTHPRADDVTLAKQLWEVSEGLVANFK